MELKFDVIKPNLYLLEDCVFFGIGDSDVIEVSRSVNESIEKHIGVLKVKKRNLEIAESGRTESGRTESGRTKKEEVYNVPLTKYLDVIERRDMEGKPFLITSDGAILSGAGYVIDSQTIERGHDMFNWRILQKDLADPQKAFDEYEKNNLVRLDRERSLVEMRRLYEELDSKMPNNYAELVILDGRIPSSNETVKPQYIGRVVVEQLKAKDKTKIEEAKKDLVERLKGVEGPCLSFDAPVFPVLFDEMIRFYNDAPALIQNYGDIVTRPSTFKLDP